MFKWAFLSECKILTGCELYIPMHIWNGKCIKWSRVLQLHELLVSQICTIWYIYIFKSLTILLFYPYSSLRIHILAGMWGLGLVLLIREWWNSPQCFQSWWQHLKLSQQNILLWNISTWNQMKLQNVSDFDVNLSGGSSISKESDFSKLWCTWY